MGNSLQNYLRWFDSNRSLQEVNMRELYNSNLLSFIRHLIWDSIKDAKAFIIRQSKHLWFPACENCADRLECLPHELKEPCKKQQQQKQDRLLVLFGVPAIIIILMVLFHADNKYDKVKQDAAAIVQTK